MAKKPARKKRKPVKKKRARRKPKPATGETQTSQSEWPVWPMPVDVAWERRAKHLRDDCGRDETPPSREELAAELAQEYPEVSVERRAAVAGVSMWRRWLDWATKAGVDCPEGSGWIGTAVEQRNYLTSFPGVRRMISDKAYEALKEAEKDLCSNDPVARTHAMDDCLAAVDRLDEALRGDPAARAEAADGEGRGRAPGIPVLTDLQQSIYDELDGAAYTAEALALKFGSKEQDAKDDSGIKRALRDMKKPGLIDNKRGRGYYRPDAPPPLSTPIK